MFSSRIQLVFIIFVLVLFFANARAAINPNAPASTEEAVYRIADRLVEKQVKTGYYTGVWPAIGGATAGSFAGTMAAGLADAYWMTCEPAYKTAAEAAGNWIWAHAPGCSLFYDDAYAFMMLSEIACDPADNPWRTALEDFYSCLEAQPPDPDYGNKEGTELFIAQIEEVLSPAYAAFEVAYYTVVAYYVDTPDKATWRNELIRLLESSNASSGQQVYALGAATWALAQTGDLDSTAIYVGSAGWTGFPGGVADQLQELPPLLNSYQVRHTAPIYFDHFYTIYNPPNTTYSGYTETNIYAVMGLDAAAESDLGYNYRKTIDETWAVNMQPVDMNGDVWYDAIEAPATGDNEKYYHYAGEYLQYLAAARLPGDIDMNDAVDIEDFETFVLYWLDILGCQCSIADLTRDHKVNLEDFARLAQGWLLSR
jgi:hypothetical protein